MPRGPWYVEAARALVETKPDIYGDIVAFSNAHPTEYVELLLQMRITLLVLYCTHSAPNMLVRSAY